jgi:hypothetical protein
MFDGEAPDEVWLAGDLELLRRSDAVLMVDGWQRSVGATAERQVAADLGLPIFYSFDDTHSILMQTWIDEWKHVQV